MINFILIMKAIIIAIVEGITEFLPVSSTGHMIIVGDIINFHGEFARVFEIVIQLGAILAIVCLYSKKIFGSIKELFQGKSKGIRFWVNIIVAFLPAAVLGFLFDDLIDEYLFNSITVAIGLLVGGILLLITENKFKNSFKTKNVDDMNKSQALKIGFFQCLALWPGMSRSSSTIIGGWLSGLSTVAATEFSFFLAIPTMVGATGLKLIKNVNAITLGEGIVLLIGFIVAFIVAYIVVEKFINYLKKKPMKIFAIYRILLSIVLFILIYFGVIGING